MGEKIKKLVGVEGDFKTAILPMINYSYANIYMGGAGYIISMYFTVFLTDVVNLSLNQAGIIVMLATVWDAVTDPVMGIITDRTRSKTGKHRRYLLWGIPLMALSYTLLWNSYGLDGKNSPATAMLYFVIVYMLYKTAYTVIGVPHTAMLPGLAPEYNLRTQYNSVGYLFNSAGMVPAFGIAVLVLSLFGSGDNITSASKAPFLVIGIVLSLFFGFAVFMTYAKTREPSSLNNKHEKLDIRYIIKEYVLVFRNRSFRQYFFMSLAYQFATGFYANSKVYYIKYLANQYSGYPLFNAVAGVAEAAAFPLNYALTMKHGKKKCGNIVTPLMVAGLAIGLIMQSGGSLFWSALMMLSMILYPFGMSGLGFVSTNIFPDLTDVDEMITGRRREGVIATFSTLIKKSISGVMAAMVGFTLQGFGLITGDTVSDYEKSTGLLFEQSASAVTGVRICVAVIPIVAALISLILLKRFRMTKDDHTMIRAAIATKHKYGSVTLTEEQKYRCEVISGQKLEKTWLGQPSATDQTPHYLNIDIDKNGNIRNKKERSNAMIDITKKAPEKREKSFKNSLLDFLFYLVQWTWGLPVNLVGGIVFLICTKIKKRRYQRFGYSYIVYLPWKSGGLSLGLFIFMKDQHKSKKWTYNTRIHEYGHTWQCLLLGPLYYIVIALPSAIWCNFFAGYRKKNNVSYYKLYCESWANAWGQKATKMEMITE